MIIDVHTHIYPERTAARTLDAIQDRAGIRAYTDGTIAGLLSSMSEAGIDLAIVSSVATRPEQVEAMNQWLREICRPPVQRFAAMHPGLVVTPDLVSTIKAQGFKGFKVHPDYQGFFVDERRLFPFYEAAQTVGLPILFHTGVDLGLPHTVHATPQRLALVSREFPRLRIIAAHLGGQDMYTETEQYLLGRDIYLDTSFVLRKIPIDIVRRIFSKHPLERFLFGSDSPWTDQKEELDFFLSLPFLTDDVKEKILGANALRLLGIE
jgi:predicted TIM-barrel fold metal-dependent hydrolase